VAPKKREEPSRRVQLDGYQQFPIMDEREQKFWDWYLENRAKRRAFPMAKMLIIAALHGEMGAQVQKAVEAGDTDIAQEALDDLLGAYLS
jgi:hypothetical protein